MICRARRVICLITVAVIAASFGSAIPAAAASKKASTVDLICPPAPPLLPPGPPAEQAQITIFVRGQVVTSHSAPGPCAAPGRVQHH